MNLHEQLGVLEVGVDQLLKAVVAPLAEKNTETPAEPAVSAAAHAVPAQAEAMAEPNLAAADALSGAPEGAQTAGEMPGEARDETPGEAPQDAAQEQVQEAAQAAAQAAAEPAPRAKPTLQVSRPSQNEITMSIDGHMVSLHPDQVGQLIEELSNARASMQPEPPMSVPPGWRFVSTKNPVMAAQKQSNGDRVLVMRHTGHGWVPFTFSPDAVFRLYGLLTQR